MEIKKLFREGYGSLKCIYCKRLLVPPMVFFYTIHFENKFEMWSKVEMSCNKKSQPFETITTFACYGCTGETIL